MPPLDKATAVRSEGKAHTLKTSALRMHEPNITAYKQITLNKSTQYHMFYERILPIHTARNRDSARPHHEKYDDTRTFHTKDAVVGVALNGYSFETK